jgi:2-isopropylmalate synthase
VTGQGNGPIDAFMNALQRECGISAEVLEYSEHSVGKGAKARAIAYLHLSVDGQTLYGVGRHESILTASVQAVLSGIARARRAGRAGARASA